MAATVVLLHGLGRTRHSLRRLKRRLESEGWDTWSTTYSSRKQSITDSAEQVARLIELELPDRELLVVTHSMGGIVVRQLADRFQWTGCVMVAPPNQGSRAARWARKVPGLQILFGPALTELAFPEKWPDPPQPSHIISGTRGVTWSSPPSWVLSCAGIFADGCIHDGTLLLDETGHESVHDHISIAAGHSTIMSNSAIIEQVVDRLNRYR
ncbi:MAG: alpha/beta fold hydrolase [Phycisphaerales bacterium]|nr:alpha/beta fold hydrolase [Phycisphaerales bacterium]